MTNKQDNRTSLKKKFLSILKDREKYLDHAIKTGELDPVGFFSLQVKIAKEIIAVEEKLNKLGAKQLTQETKNTLTKDYKYNLTILRILGDSLAWMLVKPYSIRQHVKHPPYTQLLTRQERAFNSVMAAALDLSKNQGELVLVHDLTNCLRISDLSVCRYNDCRLIEVKSIENVQELTEKLVKKVERQIKRMDGFYKLHSDVATLEPDELAQTFEGYPENTTLTRHITKRTVSLSEQTTFAQALNDLLKEVLKDGKDRFVTFDGITGYLLNTANEKRIQRLISEGGFHPTKEQIAFTQGAGIITSIDIFSRHADYSEITPLTNLFDPEIATGLIFGDLMITTILNSNKMADYLRTRGIQVDISVEKHFWKTYKYKINGSTALLGYPFMHVLYAVHSTEYLANYCIESREGAEEFKRKILAENKGSKYIDVLGDLD